MANQEQVERLKRSVEEWNQWRREHPDIKPDLSNAIFSRANLTNADLSGVRLTGTILAQAILVGTNLTRTNLLSADLRDANLSRTNLSDADLTQTNLIRTSLDAAFLYRADLSRSDLRWSKLNNAKLNNAKLNGADLSDADLTGTNLGEANLRRAILTDAKLNDADLSRSDLSEANLRRAALSGTHLEYTIFAENDLRTVKGLAQINHRTRSYISLDTVKLPQDGSALHFLRGVGVPDEWIDFYRSTMMKPIQYHSCFISYSSADELLARRLHADLQDYGVRCWFAPHDLRPGQFIRKGIDEAIHMQDKLLLILSEHSVESGWVGYEVETALSKEIRQKREILFPLRIDDAVFGCSADWACELREKRHIGDFTQWTDPLHYQQALEHFLRHLALRPFA